MVSLAHFDEFPADLVLFSWIFPVVTNLILLSIPSLIKACLNVARVFLNVIQNPFDAGTNGNSGRILLSIKKVNKIN